MRLLSSIYLKCLADAERPGRPPWADADGCLHVGWRSRHMREAQSDKLQVSCWNVFSCRRYKPGISGHQHVNMKSKDRSGVLHEIYSKQSGALADCNVAQA